jgi:hypothetical protein
MQSYIAGTEWKIVQTADDPYFLDANKIERTAFVPTLIIPRPVCNRPCRYRRTVLKPLHLRDRPGSGDGALNQRRTRWTRCTPKGGTRGKVVGGRVSGFSRRVVRILSSYYGLGLRNHCDGSHQSAKRIAWRWRSKTVRKDYMTEITWEALIVGRRARYFACGQYHGNTAREFRH